MAVLFLDASACQFSSAALALVKTPIKFRLAIYVSRKLGAKCNGSVRTLIADFAANSLLRMVIIDIESNTSVGGLTLDPAGMHCPSWDDAFVSSCNITSCRFRHK